MKCKAYGMENIYGAGPYKVCHAPHIPTDLSASRLGSGRANKAEKCVPEIQNTLNQSESNAPDKWELTPTSSKDNAYFNHFIRGARLQNTGRPGLWLLAGLIPGVNLVLSYFAMQPGQPDLNAWGHAAVAAG